MSKAEILAELARLSPEDLAEIKARLEQLASPHNSSTYANPVANARIRTPRLAKPAQARDFVKQVKPIHAAL